MVRRLYWALFFLSPHKVASKSFRRCPQVPETTSRCFELLLNITSQMVRWFQTSEAIKGSLMSDHVGKQK